MVTKILPEPSEKVIYQPDEDIPNKIEETLNNEENKVQEKIKYMAFISKINGSVEPMFSFWSIKSFSYLDQILNNNDGYKIMKFAEEIGFKYLNVNKKTEAEFFNVNNQEDYEILLNLLKIN